MLVGNLLLRRTSRNNTVGAAYMHFTLVKGRNKHWRLAQPPACHDMKEEKGDVHSPDGEDDGVHHDDEGDDVQHTPVMHGAKVGAGGNAPRVVACPRQLHCAILLVPSRASEKYTWHGHGILQCAGSNM